MIPIDLEEWIDPDVEQMFTQIFRVLSAADLSEDLLGHS